MDEFEYHDVCHNKFIIFCVWRRLVCGGNVKPTYKHIRLRTNRLGSPLLQPQRSKDREGAKKMRKKEIISHLKYDGYILPFISGININLDLLGDRVESVWELRRWDTPRGPQMGGFFHEIDQHGFGDVLFCSAVRFFFSIILFFFLGSTLGWCHPIRIYGRLYQFVTPWEDTRTQIVKDGETEWWLENVKWRKSQWTSMWFGYGCCWVFFPFFIWIISASLDTKKSISRGNVCRAPFASLFSH